MFSMFRDDSPLSARIPVGGDKHRLLQDAVNEMARALHARLDLNDFAMQGDLSDFAETLEQSNHLLQLLWRQIIVVISPDPIDHLLRDRVNERAVTVEALIRNARLVGLTSLFDGGEPLPFDNLSVDRAGKE